MTEESDDNPYLPTGPDEERESQNWMQERIQSAHGQKLNHFIDEMLTEQGCFLLLLLLGLGLSVLTWFWFSGS